MLDRLPHAIVRDATASALASGAALPRLSFVVYEDEADAASILKAIRSLAAQDYPRADFVLVLGPVNAQAAKQLTGGDPRFQIIEWTGPGGPMGAALHGLDHAGDDFVCLLDGDAELHPEFGSIHVQAHLAIHCSAAVSVGRNAGFQPGVHGGFWSPGVPGVVRESWRIPRIPSVPEDSFARLIPAVRASPPVPQKILWVKRPPQVYRRVALELTRPKADPDTLLQLDVGLHFLPLAHLFGGSLMIDLPLSNELIARDGATPAGDPALRPRRQIERLRAMFGSRDRTLSHIGHRVVDIAVHNLREGNGEPAAALDHPEVAGAFGECWRTIVDAFGAAHTVPYLHRQVGWESARRMIRLARQGRRFTREERLLLREEVRLRLWRLMMRYF